MIQTERFLAYHWDCCLVRPKEHRQVGRTDSLLVMTLVTSLGRLKGMPQVFPMASPRENGKASLQEPQLEHQPETKMETTQGVELRNYQVTEREQKRVQ